MKGVDEVAATIEDLVGQGRATGDAAGDTALTEPRLDVPPPPPRRALDPGSASASTFGASRAPEGPGGFGGFDFGSAPEGARQACGAAGATWADVTGDVKRCSAPAKAVGVEGEAFLQYCSNKLCRVTVVHRVASSSGKEWATRYGAVQQSLAARFGKGSSRSRPLSLECRESYFRCLENGSTETSHEWSFHGGRSVQLVLGRVPGAYGPSPALRLIFETPSD